MKTNNKLEIAKLLKRHTPIIQRITAALIQRARRSAPGATEKVYQGWHCAMFQYGGMKRLASIVAPQTKHVTVFLNRRPSVDPKKRLEGTGKTMGTIKIRTLKEASDPGLLRMIKASSRVTKPN